MTDTKFSSELFTQIGGSNWVTRPGYFNSPEPVKPPVNDQLVNPFVEAAVELDEKPDIAEVDRVNLHEELTADVSQAKTAVHVENAVVVIGAGLDSIWQNEESLAWRLWQNIMLAFEWDETQVVFFDTEHVASDEMIFTTMEEIIDLGVEWVLTMDREHPIVEQLSEGVSVIEVPGFDDMLSDAYAKKSFYHSVVNLL